MTLDEKLQIAEALESLRVDIVEAGFPAASPGDFSAVRTIAGRLKETVVAGLARARKEDILQAGEALRGAERSRIHTFISTSPLHMRHKLRMRPEEVLDAIISSVGLARNLCADVEWSCEDGSRSAPDFLCRCVEAAISAGATTINIPDTVGYAIPKEIGALFSMLRERVPNMDKARLSTHCHDDLGLATANSLAAVAAGARQVECTLNGIGERAGNAALEEVVMAMKTRSQVLPFTCGVETTSIARASRLLSSITGFLVPPNKAIIGANAFAHEAGIHQDGMLKHAQTYEIMTPESVGIEKSSLILGKHSGRHAFQARLKDLGFGRLEPEQIEETFRRFKSLADCKKKIFDEDLVALVEDTVLRHKDRLRLVSLEAFCSTRKPQHARVELLCDAQTFSAEATGNGPVDAIFKCISKISPHNAELELYQVQAVTSGADAQAEVFLRLREEGLCVNGQGADVDTLIASALAYINALNRLLRAKDPHAGKARGV